MGLVDTVAIKKEHPIMENDFETIPKAEYDELKASITMMRLDYEARLKADLVAMLTEIQLEIEEQRQDNPEFNIWKDGYNTANDIDCVIIQQKINSLKEQP